MCCVGFGVSSSKWDFLSSGEWEIFPSSCFFFLIWWDFFSSLFSSWCVVCKVCVLQWVREDYDKWDEAEQFWSGGNSFGVFNNGSISDLISILLWRCLFKTKKLFPSYVKKRKCAKMIFSLTAASAGLSSWKEKNNYWMFFSSNCNRSKQNVTVGSRFKVLKNRTTSA